MKELPPLDPCGPGVAVKANPIINSRSIFESIIFHLLHPDDSSVAISHHLLKVTDRKPPSIRPEQIPEEFYTNALFYYRCFNCRCMVGDPLADALSLPFHPNFWMRTNIRLLSTFSFILVRIYTNLARWVSPARRWIVRWHTKGLNAFHETWSMNHKSKMAYALGRNKKASILDLENIKKGNDSNTSFCPFAMTAKPT